MPTDCLFCRIASGDIPAKVAYQDEHVVAFHDIHPQAPVHLLVIPREHVASLSELEDRHAEMAGRLMVSVPRVATSVGGLDDGFRLIVNNGAAAGQTVPHLHLHILGGRAMGEGMV